MLWRPGGDGGAVMEMMDVVEKGAKIKAEWKKNGFMEV